MAPFRRRLCPLLRWPYEPAVPGCEPLMSYGHANESARLVRTWCMRGTLHLVAPEDFEWLLSLLGPLFVRADRRRLAQLGLDEDATAQGCARFERS
jgi:winged helix DNA-binding protein